MESGSPPTTCATFSSASIGFPRIAPERLTVWAWASPLRSRLLGGTAAKFRLRANPARGPSLAFSCRRYDLRAIHEFFRIGSHNGGGVRFRCEYLPALPLYWSCLLVP